MRVIPNGLLPPTEGRCVVVLEQLWLANRYYNDLASIENGRRAAVRRMIDASETTIAQLVAEHEDATARADAACVEIKAQRVQQRGRKVSIEMARDLSEAKQSRAVVGALLAVARRRSRIALAGVQFDERAGLDPTVLVGALGPRPEGDGENGKKGKKKDGRSRQEKFNDGKRLKKLRKAAVESGALVPSPIDEINEVAASLARNAREHCGVYAGTYLRTEAAVRAAIGDTPLHEDVRYHRFDGEGVVGPQVQWVGKADGRLAPLTGDLLGGSRLATLARIEDVRPIAPCERVGLVAYLAAQADLLAATGLGAEQIAAIPRLGTLPGWATLPVVRRREIAKAVNTERALPLPDAAPRQDARAVLRVRIASDDRNQPVWARFPMLLDRPLPDGIVKWVSVSRRMIGPREQWSAQITIDEPPRAPSCGAGTAVVHLGWYREEYRNALQVAGGARSEAPLRVATWMDEHGNSGHLHLPADEPHAREPRGVESGFDKADSIESIRSRSTDTVKAWLLDWLEVHEEDLPEWMRQYAHSHSKDGISTMQSLRWWLPRWKAPGRLAALMRRWRDNRFDGDDEALLGLSLWRYNDHHLWHWQRSQETRAQRRRRDAYRVFAAQIVRRYGRIVIDDTDYSAFARADAPGGVPVVATSSRQDGGDGYACADDWKKRQRRLAAPSILRDTIVNAAKRDGAVVEKVSAKKESIECPKCSTTHPAQNHIGAHWFACSGCTFEADVDAVGCLNSLRRAGVDVNGIIERMGRLAEHARAAE